MSTSGLINEVNLGLNRLSIGLKWACLETSFAILFGATNHY